MGEKTKILCALVIGAIAGVAIVKLLESEKGKEFIGNAEEKVKDTANDIEAKINQLENELAELLIEKQNDYKNQA
jgi:uncharacterized membrane-anchored protein YhcB (DUF1043 family)